MNRRPAALVFTGLFLGQLFVTAAFSGVSEGLKALDAGQIPEAAKEFQAGFDAGDADGAFYLGRLFELGLGTKPDLARAAQLYAVAADKGSAKAENRYGLMFLQGQPVLKDFAKGTDLVCKAAAAGDANGQFNCGVSYNKGLGVAVDVAKARSWWDKAAAQDNIAAINFLGQSYATGDQPDLAKALGLFERTAAFGNPMGLFGAAKIYANEKGPHFDKVKAYAWANLAAARFDPEAAAFRDQLEQGMSAADIASAQKMSAAWVAVTPGTPAGDMPAAPVPAKTK